ncbi:zinc finger protein 541-like [Culicoides brevitarsis]|uniref:zinc finger protein 541-like n=1 Tax=Culicoides brevitarsis TaxID=469753 RepID=UPI00307B9F83
MISIPKQDFGPSKRGSVFQSSYESFLSAKEVNNTPKPVPSINNNKDEVIELVPVVKKRGRKSIKELEELASSRPESIQNQLCDNCPSLIHLIYQHLNEIAAGRRNPIQYGTPSTEILEHLSEALGYNARQIQKMIETAKNPFRCRHCTEAFATKIEWKLHFSGQHADLKTVACLKCEKMFQTKENLRVHMQKAHKPKPKKDFPCPLDACSKEYATLKMLKRHLTISHKDQQKFLNLDEQPEASKFEQETQTSDEKPSIPVKKGRGRPVGSKNSQPAATLSAKRARITKQKIF